jgi:hypothetical protein
MKYFSYISHSLVTKNNLEKAVAALLESKERMVIDESNIEAFKQELKDDISKLNEKHNRCTPIKISFWSPHGSNDLHLEGAHFCKFIFLSSKAAFRFFPGVTAAAAVKEGRSIDYSDF